MTTFTELNWSVQFDTGTIRDVTSACRSASITLGTDQDNAACTLRFAVYPAFLTLGRIVYVYGMLGAGTPPILFNGIVQRITSRGDYNETTVVCTDYLSRLRHPWSKDVRTYTSQDSSAVIQNLIEASGIDPSLTSIQAPSGWTIGVGSDVVLKEGDTPIALAQLICESMPNWFLCTRSNGAIYAGPIEETTPVASYDWGDSNVIDLEYSEEVPGRLFNACRVTGATYNDVPVEELYQASWGNIEDPPEYITRTINSYLIEDPTRALAVATAAVEGTGGRIDYRARAKVLLTDAVQPGTTVTLDGTEFFVTNVTISLGEGTGGVTEFEAMQVYT